MVEPVTPAEIYARALIAFFRESGASSDPLANAIAELKRIYPSARPAKPAWALRPMGGRNGRHLFTPGELLDPMPAELADSLVARGQATYTEPKAKTVTS